MASKGETCQSVMQSTGIKGTNWQWKKVSQWWTGKHTSLGVVSVHGKRTPMHSGPGKRTHRERPVWRFKQNIAWWGARCETTTKCQIFEVTKKAECIVGHLGIVGNPKSNIIVIVEPNNITKRSPFYTKCSEIWVWNLVTYWNLRDIVQQSSN